MARQWLWPHKIVCDAGSYWQPIYNLSPNGFVPPYNNYFVEANYINTNFMLDPLYASQYPRFTDLVKKLSSYVQSDTKVMEALMMYSGLTQTQIQEKVKYGTGPTIRIVEMTGLYGYFSKLENPNVINISASYVRGLEQSNLTSTKQATSFLLSVIVLHEFVHQARASQGLDRTYEYGIGFENVAYGLHITAENAYQYSYRFYKK